MARSRSIAAAAALLALAACRPADPPPVASAPVTKVAMTRPAPRALAGDESRTLCLAEPDGKTPVDAQLRKLQGSARTKAATPDTWVLLGRQWVRKARLSSDAGFYLNVGACASVALTADPELAGALELRTLVLMNDHAFDQARAACDEILKRDPHDLVALGTKSDALLELGRYDAAAQAAQLQMDERPGMAAHARASYLRWLHGDTAGAKRMIRDALVDRDGRDPEPAAWTFVEAANIYWHQGDHDGADALYGEALRWVPDYPPALVGRARVALAKGDPTHAASSLAKAWAQRPLVETAWLLGDAQEAAGNAAAAQKAWADAVRLGHRGDKLTLALFLAVKNRDTAEAVALAREEHAVRPSVYVEDALSWALFRAGQITEARQASDRALRLGTPDPRLLYHAGAIRLAQGDKGGRALVEKALALNPAFDRTGVAEAHALLAGQPGAAMASN